MESFGEVVNLVKEYVKERVSDVAFKCWISFIEPVKFDNSRAIIYIKTSFQRDILMKQYYEKICAGFESILGFSVEVIISTEDDIRSFLSAGEYPENVGRLYSKETLGPETSAEDAIENGNYEYSFDTFIVGPSNNFAYAACKAVATQQQGSSYNPLFIYGPSGLGKTHLLLAIANETKKSHPEQNVITISSETFTNELIAAIQSKGINAFHNKYRKADILLVDDIQFISGKESTQEEFFHTFNELYQDGRQIVLTSDRPPKDIQTLEDRLKSRFEWGLITDISPPDFETRIAIINRKADLLQFKVPSDVSEFIANRLKTNIRQLEGAVKKLKANQMLLDTPPSVSMAQTVIKEILNDNQPVPVTVERIIEEVAKTYSVSPEDIRSQKRSAQISLARQVSIYIVRDVTQMSMAPIGDEFGGRDHSTIVYALKQVEKQMANDPRQKAIIDDIIKNIKNH